MGILSKLFNLFKEKKHHNQRTFVEILRTADQKEASDVKSKLEKYKIPVYVLDHADSNHSSSGKIILRVSEKYLTRVEEILKEKN